MDLTKIFGQFVGQTLKDPRRSTDECDLVLAQIEQAAKDNNLRLRVRWPGRSFTQEQAIDRVNVQLDPFGPPYTIQGFFIR